MSEGPRRSRGGTAVGERLRGRATALLRRVGVRTGSAWAFAAAWHLATRPVPVAGLSPSPRARRLVLLPKVGGTEDVVAALSDRGATDLQLVALPRAEVKAVWRSIMLDLSGVLTEVGYLSDDPVAQQRKDAYRDLLARILRRYVRTRRVAGFVSANYAYRAERELAAAAERLGVPFLVLHKESLRTPAQRPWFTRAYRELLGPFGGRSIAVYNASERDSMLEAGVVAPGRVHVTGSPRIDALHRLRETRGLPTAAGRPSEPPLVVLFAIDPDAGTWTPFGRESGADAPRWVDLAAQTEAAVVAVAEEDPDTSYAIKVKLGREAATLARLPSPLPPNVAVITGGTATELLARADAAIAFNSTVVAEAIAAGVPLVVPGFAEARRGGDWLLPLEDAVVMVGSPEGLGPALRAARAVGSRAELGEAQRRLLEHLVGDAGGRAGDRVWDWLRTELLGPSNGRTA